MKKMIFAVTAMAVLMLVALPVAEAAGNNTAITKVNTATASKSGSQSLLIMNGGETRIPPIVPQGVAPQVPITPFFGSMNQLPAVAKGTTANALYLNKCNTTATRKHMLKDVFSKGASEKTMVVWSPSQDYYINKITSISDPSRPKKYKHYTNGIPTQTARASFPDEVGKYQCLGLLTIQAKDGNQIPLSTVASDGRIYALQKLHGFANVNLISTMSLVATAKGVKSGGSGFSIAPGLVAMASSLLGGGAFSAGYTSGGSDTRTAVQVGTTFFVVAKAKDGEGISFYPNPKVKKLK